MKIRKHKSNPDDKRKTEQGSALLEVVVAISILAIGLLAIASMQVAAIRGNSFAGNVTEGTCMASDRLEKLMSQKYDHADLAAGAHTDPSPPSGYTITWNVTDDSPLSNTKTITLTVIWANHGAQKSVAMQRIIPKMI
jgi:type IV pilus assembly protein PilV